MHPKAFTLPELLIGVTISALIMSVGAIFLGSGIENAFRIRKTLEQTDSWSLFDSALTELGNFGGELSYSGGFALPYGTGVLLKNLDASAPITILSTLSVTGICDAFTGTADDPGTKERLVISKYFFTGTGGDTLPIPYDTGEFRLSPSDDQILFVNGALKNVFLDRNFGIRFPRSLALSGDSLFIAEGEHILKVEDSTEDGSAFSVIAPVLGGFSFDTAEVSILPPWPLPSLTGSYVFAGTSPNTLAILGNTGTLHFTPTSIPVGDSSFLISPIPSPPSDAGSYAIRILLQNAGSTVFDQTFPYFTRGDGNLATMSGNIVSVVSDELPYPHNVTSAWGFDSEILDYLHFPLVAPTSETVTSDRFVENVSLSVEWTVLTLSYTEYTHFDCLSGRHTKKERILKIPLR